MKLFFAIALLLFPSLNYAQDLATALPRQLPEAAEIELAELGVSPAVGTEEETVYDFPVLPEPLLHNPTIADRKKPDAALQGEELWLQAMKKTLIAKGAGEQIALDGVRFGRNVRDARLEATKWQVQDVVVEEKANRFSGKLVAEGKEAIPFRGRYGAMQLVPVLNHRLEKGATVLETDIAMKPVLAQRVRTGTTITAAEQIVGKKLKRMAKEGQPLRAYDVEMPAAVLSNSEVEMVYASNGVFLVDRGFAMDSGSVGDVIRVRNAKSGNILRARVDAENRVTVNYFATPKQTTSARNLGESHALN